MILIKNAHVVPMDGAEFDGCVLLQDGKIAQVGPDVTAPEGAEVDVIDAEGQWLLPGLIDAHAHVGLWEEAEGWAGQDVNEMTNPVTAAVQALDAINPHDLGFDDALTGGITALNILPGSGNAIGGLSVVVSTYGSIIDNMVLRHPSGLKSALGENPKRVYGDQKKTPSTRLGVAQVIRAAIHKARDYQAKKDAGETVAFDMDSEHINLVLRGEIPWRQHCHRIDDIATAIRLSKEFGYRMILDHGTEAYIEAETIAAEGIPVLVGPMISSRSKVELRYRTTEAPAILHEAGVKVCIITDHPVVPIEYLITQAAIAMRDGMPRQAALEAVTTNPAEVLGLSDQIGSITPGKRADVALWSGDPLLISSRCTATFVGGELVYEY